MSHGYTLIEVLAVITLLLLALLLVTPNLLNSGERYQLESVRRLLTADLQLLRDEFLAGAAIAELEFTKDGYLIRLEERQISRNFHEYHIFFTVDAVVETPLDTAVSPALRFSMADPTPLVVSWRSPHRSGSLTINADATLEWEYDKD